MYEIWADDLLIHSDITPLETTKVINPVLTLEDSAAGSLEFSLPPINVGYSQDILKRMVTNITVKENGEWLWSGRILQDSFDFWNNRKIICEGELAFLNDSIQPPKRYDVEHDHTTIETFFTDLIRIHNEQVYSDRQFQVGTVSVVDGDMTDNSNSIYRFTNYETTLECINDKLLERLKGHIRIRHQEGLRYIDYIRDEELTANNQIVRFGVNLLDFSKNIDMSELATVIVPRGARLEIDESDPRYIEGLEPYLTVESLGVKTETFTNPDGTTRTETWHKDKSMFVENETARNNFGWICAVVDWDAVTDPNTLYTKAAKYLKDEQYEKMTLEIQALDLKYLQQGDDPIRFQSKLRCISDPHGMDHTFIVSKMQIDLTNPGNSIYTLGTDVKLSLTQAASRVNSQVQAQIDKIPSKHEILRAAENNAYQMIMGTKNSYVHFISSKDENGKSNGIQRIEITDGSIYAGDPTDDEPNKDPFPNSLHRWIWTLGGLGHIGRADFQSNWNGFNPETGKFDPTLNLALTMDGKIVADSITTGILKAYNTTYGQTYALDTGSGYVSMRYGDIAGFIFQLITDSNSPFYNQEILSKGDAVLSKYVIGCGKAGTGIVNLVGNDSTYGYIQISNSGNPYSCLDGIRIYGDGHVVRYDGNGNQRWDRWLSNIPTS